MIRRATPADRSAIRDLHLASWRDSYGTELSAAYLRDDLPADMDAKWAARTFAPPELTLVALTDTELTGFACALTDYKPLLPTAEPLLPTAEPPLPTAELPLRTAELPLRTAELPLIDNLHVRPDLRGGGTGAKLLAAMKIALAEAGFTRATLTVLASNPRALAFYLANGGSDEGDVDDMLVGHPVRARRIGFDLR